MKLRLPRRLPPADQMSPEDEQMAQGIAIVLLVDGGPYEAAHVDAQLDELKHARKGRPSSVAQLAAVVHQMCLDFGWRRCGESPAQFRDRMREEMSR